jgi:hypothetical protein
LTLGASIIGLCFTAASYFYGSYDEYVNKPEVELPLVRVYESSSLDSLADLESLNQQATLSKKGTLTKAQNLTDSKKEEKSSNLSTNYSKAPPHIFNINRLR